MFEAERVLSNRSIDTDVLSAGVARLLSAGHLRRYMAAYERRALPPLMACISSATDVRALVALPHEPFHPFGKHPAALTGTGRGAATFRATLLGSGKERAGACGFRLPADFVAAPTRTKAFWPRNVPVVAICRSGELARQWA